MSLQMRLARAAADAAAEAWKAHRRSCSQCDLAIYRRRYGELCPAGRTALDIRQGLAARAEAEAAADRAPNPAQEVLFGEA